LWLFLVGKDRVSEGEEDEDEEEEEEEEEKVSPVELHPCPPLVIKSDSEKISGEIVLNDPRTLINLHQLHEATMLLLFII
jgi:hypothetical protein